MATRHDASTSLKSISKHKEKTDWSWLIYFFNLSAENRHCYEGF